MPGTPHLLAMARRLPRAEVPSLLLIAFLALAIGALELAALGLLQPRPAADMAHTAHLYIAS